MLILARSESKWNVKPLQNVLVWVLRIGAKRLGILCEFTTELEKFDGNFTLNFWVESVMVPGI